VPAAHASHAALVSLPLPAVDLPAVQFVHSALDAAAYVPLAHSVHSCSAVWAHIPAVHPVAVTHDVLFASANKLKVEQSEQLVAPAAATYPAVQGSHALW
jgi:hypothetical protein